MNNSSHFPYLVPLLFSFLVLLGSCGTEVDDESPVPTIENLSANPPVVSPGGKSDINIGIAFDKPSPNLFLYRIGILDGGELIYETENSIFVAEGEGNVMELELNNYTLDIEWTAPDNPGEYAFAISAAEAMTPENSTRDTLTVTVTQ